MTINSKALVEAIEWYAAQVADCRKRGLEGDTARAKLDRDGGYKARTVLQELEQYYKNSTETKDKT